VLARLAPRHGVEVVRITDEDEYFPPPRNIRELQSSIELASTALLGGSILARPVMDGRNLPASEVLAALAD
jgi:4-hydroxy-3-methylbut-2-enyl diphosphate reductase